MAYELDSNRASLVDGRLGLKVGLNLGALIPLPLQRGWVDRIRAGDQEAFAALFHAFYPTLCSVVARRVDSEDVARDLVQDVFVSIWERRDALDPEQSIAGYLHRAARNRALNYLKHRSIVHRSRAALKVWLLSPQTGPDEEVRYAELAEVLDEAIEHLPERRREVFLLSRHGQQSYAEIAELLGISIKTVETQMGRALKSLRSALLPYL